MFAALNVVELKDRNLVLVCSALADLSSGLSNKNSKPLMASKRYTIIVADRRSGVIRRATVSLRPILVVSGIVLTLPVLIGIGAAWKAKSEVADLRASHQTLQPRTRATVRRPRNFQVRSRHLNRRSRILARVPLSTPISPGRWTSCPRS